MRLKPEPQSLFPTRDSLDQVIQEAKAEYPPEFHPKLHHTLMVYHNTLLHSLSKSPIPTQGEQLELPL